MRAFIASILLLTMATFAQAEENVPLTREETMEAIARDVEEMNREFVENIQEICDMWNNATQAERDSADARDLFFIGLVCPK